MTATSLDLSQIKTDALLSAATFRTLIGLGSSDAVTFDELLFGTRSRITSSAVYLNLGKYQSTTFASLQFANSGLGTFLLRYDTNAAFGWGTSASEITAKQVVVYPDAANILAQRNGTNAQTFRLYNAYTSSTSFENLQFQWNTNEARIGTSVGSAGGTQRDLVLGAWNNAGAFTSWLSFATSGAATFSSQLIGIQGTSSVPSFTFSGDLNTGIYSQYADQLRMSCGGGDVLALTASIAAFYKPIRADLIYGISNILEVRNGTNAQTFRLYNTYTSSTSFERLNVRWATNELIIDAEAGSGGGTLRGIKIGSATTSLLGFYGVTPVDQPSTVADPAGGAIVDSEARTAIGEIIDRLQEIGLIA